MTFQDRLYQLRKERGISQEELSNVVGVSRQAVQKWESGSSRPDMENLTILARYFDVTLDYLINGTEPLPHPESPLTANTNFPLWHYEYRSNRTLFGLPLVHIHLGMGRLCRARGIVAIGNLATGVFAAGGLSMGLISIGALSLGGLTLGGLSVGVAALGGLAAGVVAAFGGLALSFGLACGGLAVGGAWAVGGAAFARQIAAGGFASAPIAIGDMARGSVTFPKAQWGPDTAEAIRSAILQQFPHTPGFLVNLFSSLL